MSSADARPDRPVTAMVVDHGEGDPETELEVLHEDECWALLRLGGIGRVAVGRDPAPPLVVPVNFAVADDVIVLRSGPGSKLIAMRTSRVAFQIDAFDMANRTGWSVLVEGTVNQATREPVEGTSVEPWAPGAKPFWVRILVDGISGRRIRLPAVSPDESGYL